MLHGRRKESRPLGSRCGGRRLLSNSLHSCKSDHSMSQKRQSSSLRPQHHKFTITLLKIAVRGLHTNTLGRPIIATKCAHLGNDEPQHAIKDKFLRVHNHYFPQQAGRHYLPGRTSLHARTLLQRVKTLPTIHILWTNGPPCLSPQE